MQECEEWHASTESKTSMNVHDLDEQGSDAHRPYIIGEQEAVHPHLPFMSWMHFWAASASLNLIEMTPSGLCLKILSLSIVPSRPHSDRMSASSSSLGWK